MDGQQSIGQDGRRVAVQPLARIAEGRSGIASILLASEAVYVRRASKDAANSAELGRSQERLNCYADGNCT